jgi:type IV pilus assembly protein PilQ
VTTLDKQGQENLVTEVFSLNYAKAADVAASVGEMRSERGKIKFDSRSNLVIVTDIPTNIYRISKVVERLDSMTPQVTIEAKIIETSLSNADDLGIKWNASYTASMSKRPTTFPWPSNNVGNKYDNWLPKGDDASMFATVSQPAFPLSTVDDFSFGILDGTAFSVLLEAIETRGKTRILSNPSITTLDNESAEIHVGTDWPIANYSYNEETDRFVITGWEYKSYGILLRVTPTINQNGYVTLKLHPEISDKQEEIDFQGARVPVLTTQSMDATVMIKDGQTLVIGGLIKDKKVTTKTKVPFLGDIPLVGLLFTHKAEEIIKNDLMIFITPHIVVDANLAKRPAAELIDTQGETTTRADAVIEKMVAGSDDEFLKQVGIDTAGEDAAAKEQPVATKKTVLPEQKAKVSPAASTKNKDTEQQSNKGVLFRK